MTVFNCHQVLDRASLYIDSELTEDETVAIDTHLRGCLGCAEEYAVEQRISSMLISSDWNPVSTEELVQKAMTNYLQKRSEN